MKTIENLATTRLVSGERYKLAPKLHTITQPFKLADNVIIDPAGAKIAFNSDIDSPAVSIFGCKNVKWLEGAEFILGSNRYAAYIEHSVGVLFAGAKLTPATGKAIGGGFIIRTSTNVTLRKNRADRVSKYFLFAERGNVGLLVSENVLTQGSRPDTTDPAKSGEAGIRLMDSVDVQLIDNHITANIPGAKNSAIRMQDGMRFSVLGGKYVGGFGAGPLADGDGGRAWGITRWYLTNGKTVDSPTQPTGADVKRTLSKRADMIGCRLRGVSVIGAEIVGPITLEAGLESYVHLDGSVTAPTIFTGITWKYPEIPRFTLPGDTIRSQAQGYFYGTQMFGDARQNPVDLIDCFIGNSRQSIPAFIPN